VSDDDKKPSVSKEERRELFTVYESIVADELRLERELEQTRRRRNEAVKVIYERCGKGPFRYQGRLISVVRKGNAYFFRGPKDREAEEI